MLEFKLLRNSSGVDAVGADIAAVSEGQLFTEEIAVRTIGMQAVLLGILLVSCKNQKCEVVSKTSVGWDEMTELGIPSDHFVPVAGTCTEEFTVEWEGPNSGPFSVDVSGETHEVTTTIDIDESSVKLVKRKVVDTTITDLSCHDFLRVNAKVTLDVLGNLLFDEEEVALETNPYQPYIRVDLDADEASIINWSVGASEIEVDIDEDALDVTLDVEIMPVQMACAGNMSFEVRDQDSGDWYAGYGRLGTWRDSECEMWELPVDLTEDPGLPALNQELAEVWSDQLFPGGWEFAIDSEPFGAPSNLTVSVTPTELQFCINPNEMYYLYDLDLELEVPAHITVNTEDGRVQDLSGEGVFLYDAETGGVGVMGDLEMETQVYCASDDDTLPYTPADCSEVDYMTAKLTIVDFGQWYSDLRVTTYPLGSGAYDEDVRFVLD